jgi:hypothetical protein
MCPRSVMFAAMNRNIPDNFIFFLTLHLRIILVSDHLEAQFLLQGVPLATETGISLIILPLMRILQLSLKWTYLIV